MKQLLCMLISLLILPLGVLGQDDLAKYYSKVNIDNETKAIVDECFRNMATNATIVFANAQKISKKGYSIGDYLLGWCYEGGEGTDYNPQQSVVFFLKAANAHIPFPYAYQALGVHYYQAIGVPRDVKKSFYWYKKGAESIVNSDLKADCICSMAVQYQYGEGVKQDSKEACRLYEIAASMGNGRAARNLSNRYALGEGVVKDVTKSFYWMEKAAELGDVDFQFLTGIIYYTGGNEDLLKIEKINKEKGIFWLKEAAKNGSLDAMKAINELRIK